MRMVEVGRGGAEARRRGECGLWGLDAEARRMRMVGLDAEALRRGELLFRKLHTGLGAFNEFVDDAVYTFHQGFLVEIDK